jgi:hypothetical protein
LPPTPPKSTTFRQLHLCHSDLVARRSLPFHSYYGNSIYLVLSDVPSWS